MPPKRKRGEDALSPQQRENLHKNQPSPSHSELNGLNVSPKSPPQSHERHPAGPIAISHNGEGSPTQKAELVKVDGDVDDVRMEQPPKAGLVDPAGGYKTNAPAEDRVVRVYADGVFDLFHLGHMRQLEQAKNAFPRTHLTVGVTGDDETHRRKGLTVLSARERAESLRHCRWVDAVLEDCPWVVTDEFLEEHKFDYVAHDDLPYGAAEGDDIYAPIKAAGKFLVTQRTEGVSTTGIITKIVKDYNNYVGRQLKRGMSRQDLNVSWLKKNELELKRHVGDIRDAVRTNWSNTGQELGREINKMLWSDRSRPASPGPSALQTPVKEAPGPPNIALQAQMNRLDIPKSPSSPGPGGWGSSSRDFVTGYTLGLVGGIRSWMTRNQRNVGEGENGIQERSSASSESDDENAQIEEPSEDVVRGRQSKRLCAH